MQSMQSLGPPPFGRFTVSGDTCLNRAVTEEEKLEKQYQDASDAELEDIKKREGKNSGAGKIVHNILTKRRPESRNSARIITWASIVTAVATAAAALATWIIVCRPQTAPNESRQAASSVTPTPSP
jgi:hypothetical protein